jgi:flavin reductase (DIM6/NTAB) family NADH-FMN oxidoreductase RutF
MKTVGIDVSKLPFPEAYKLIIGSIVPRPIAWVSTVNGKGQTNLAPFSFFNGVCSNPPSLLFCPVNHPDGREKDTLKNVRETKQFVVNIASEDLAKAMNQTSGNYPSDISEFKEAGLTPAKSAVVKPPRVLESPINIECELIQVVTVGPGGPGSGSVVIGKIVYMHIFEEAYKDGKILIDKVKPIARLAGASYCPVREIFDLPRPVIS